MREKEKEEELESTGGSEKITGNNVEIFSRARNEIFHLVRASETISAENGNDD